jgi:hypothetical protein
MKIEIRKETTWEKTWFWTYIDNKLDHVFYTIEEAEKRMDEIIANYKKPPVIEIIKVAELEDPKL